MLTAKQLTAIMPYLTSEIAETHLPHIRKAAKAFGIDTKLRVAAWLANVAVETGQLRWFRELDSFDGTYLRSKTYYPYFGRGAIHLTRKENYRAAGDFLGLDLVDNPDRAAESDVAWEIAGWFWRHRSAQGDLNLPADVGDFDTTILGVNGGWNGYTERWAYYMRALEVLASEAEEEEVTEAKPRERRIQFDGSGWAHDGEVWLISEPNLTIYTNEEGWVYKLLEAKAWEWPEANEAPIPGSAWYAERCPTRYAWRPDVEAWARWLVENYSVWVNTYHNHPEDVFLRAGESRMMDSYDVWGPSGRGDPLDPALGDELFGIIFNDPNPPNIEWIIYKRRMYGAWNSWYGEPFGDGSVFMNHDDHIHVTYLR